MPLNETQQDELETLLNGLNDVLNKLAPNQKQFVEQIFARYQEFAENTFITTKQLDWLENLYKKNVGSIPY
jgi:hypothetical protein